MPKPVDPEPPRANDSETAEEREQRTVHDVYESIAGHFSQTRYKVRELDLFFPRRFLWPNKF